MSRRTLRSRADICHLCEYMGARQPLRQTFRTRKPPPGAASSGHRPYSQKLRASNGPGITVVKTTPPNPVASKRPKGNERHATEEELEKAFEEVRATANALLSSDKIPSEAETNYALGRCGAMAKLLVFEPPTPSLDRKNGATSALLSLDESSAKKISVNKLPPALQRMADQLSSFAYFIIKHPLVFITPAALEMYVEIQATLGKSQTFPEVFHLYASKPIPRAGTSPIKYTEQNPNKVANAISIPVADRALQTAINSKQLVVAMDIIECAYTTKAFRRAKFIRKGLLPATGVAVAPAAAYTIASQLAILQTTMDSAMATNVAFAGILAYVGFTATIGVVAVTTANDQMDRVTWAPGVPLRERWMREEERAAIDKIAGAWGFRESWRRGEEEGEDWDVLREWIGRKSMMLDRVELMEGME
ncbi:hypothetical protein N431DRAFT_436203 [Stipitochalara longipes BDJ]|nr:hypothetical protein N431DRAFT_436203 [Stipitochalara longipes BDJ]